MLPAALLAVEGALPEADAAGRHLHRRATAWGPVRSVRAARPQAPYAAAVLDADPEARLLTVVVLFSAGSSRDPLGQEGTAALLASVLRRQAAGALARYGATVETELTADDLLVTLLTPPDAWREAIIALERLLYEAPLSASALEGARSERLEILAFEAGAPVRAFELERTRLLLGPDARGARPAHGSPASVGALALADLEAFRASHLRAEDATFAAHGPVEAAGLASLLASEIEELPRRSRAMDRDGVPPGREEPLPPAPLLLHLGTREVAGIPPPGAGPAAWEDGARVLVDLELTSSWVSVAFPFPAGTPDLRLDFLAHLIREELSPRPPSPGLFRSDVSKVMIEDAPVLVLTASVDPRITLAWEARLTGLMEQMATQLPEGAFFQLATRRFRTQTLLEHALPEKRVGWVARRRAAGLPPAPDLVAEIRSLDRSTVMRTAGAAGPPRVIVHGPRSMMEP